MTNDEVYDVLWYGCNYPRHVRCRLEPSCHVIYIACIVKVVGPISLARLLNHSLTILFCFLDIQVRYRDRHRTDRVLDHLKPLLIISLTWTKVVHLAAQETKPEQARQLNLNVSVTQPGSWLVRFKSFLLFLFLAKFAWKKTLFWYILHITYR